MPGERWLDLCAGPGGKAALLAAEALRGRRDARRQRARPGARRTRAPRARARARSTSEVWERDGTTLRRASTPSAFDRILLDAPCTGLGALRRRPEARWRKTPRDVAELTALQARAARLRGRRPRSPAALLAYVTCSPHSPRRAAIVAAALERHAGALEPLDTAAVLQELAAERLDLAGDPTHVQLWPHRHGTDAMFIALLDASASDRPADGIG